MLDSVNRRLKCQLLNLIHIDSSNYFNSVQVAKQVSHKHGNIQAQVMNTAMFPLNNEVGSLTICQPKLQY